MADIGQQRLAVLELVRLERWRWLHRRSAHFYRLITQLQLTVSVIQGLHRHRIIFLNTLSELLQPRLGRF